MSTARGRTARRPPALVLLGAGLGLAVLALPFAGLLQRTAWSRLGRDLGAPATVEALRLSLVTSLAATVVVVLVGTPLAWVLARVELPGRSILRSLVLLPMVLPPVVGGVALLSAFSLRTPLGGWLDRTLGLQLTYSPIGVVLAQTFVALPFFVITVEAGLGNVDQRYEQVGAGLGASRATVFRRITLPLVAPSMAAGAVLAWARALGEFGATLTFAGNIGGRTRTLPLLVYLQLEADPEAAIASSLVLLFVSFAVLVGLRGRWLVRR